MDEILLFLKKEEADLVLLQEVYDGHHPIWERKFRSMDVVREELGYPYEDFAPAFLERTEFGTVQQGNAVLSRFPIVKRGVVFYDKPYAEREDRAEFWEGTPRNLQYVTVDINGRTIEVFNTQGVWGKDGEDNPRRLLMAQTIVDAIRSHKDVILAGDFNVQEKTESIALIEKHLVNIFKNERTTSFNLRHKTHPGFATAVVDMIFVSPQFTVLEKRSCEENVSDHLALTVTIEI